MRNCLCYTHALQRYNGPGWFPVHYLGVDIHHCLHEADTANEKTKVKETEASPIRTVFAMDSRLTLAGPCVSSSGGYQRRGNVPRASPRVTVRDCSVAERTDNSQAFMDANNLYRFLLAEFSIDHIVKFPTAGKIKQALSDFSIPETRTIDASDLERENERRMDEVYNRIVCRIRAQPRDIQKYAFRALSWIGYATRTLTIQELLVAISVEANQYQLDDGDMLEFGDLLDICGGLIIADGEDVRLVHFSVRNYLDRHKVIPEDIKETYRAIACSTYLSFDIFKERQCPPRDLDAPKENLAFQCYAADNLMFHLSKVERRHYPETTSAVMRLLEDKGQRGAYCMAKEEIREQLDIPRLNLACAIGYEDAVRTLLEEDDVDVNAKDIRIGLTPLSWAVLMGHKPVVRLLLSDDRVDRDCKDFTGSTPLWVAISKKKTGIVRLLLENRAELNFTYEIVSKCNYYS